MDMLRSFKLNHSQTRFQALPQPPDTLFDLLLIVKSVTQTNILAQASLARKADTRPKADLELQRFLLELFSIHFWQTHPEKETALRGFESSLW